MNNFIFKIILVKIHKIENIVHPKKDLIFALNFGGSQG